MYILDAIPPHRRTGSKLTPVPVEKDFGCSIPGGWKFYPNKYSSCKTAGWVQTFFLSVLRIFTVSRSPYSTCSSIYLQSISEPEKNVLGWEIHMHIIIQVWRYIFLILEFTSSTAVMKQSQNFSLSFLRSRHWLFHPIPKSQLHTLNALKAKRKRHIMIHWFRLVLQLLHRYFFGFLLILAQT